MIGSVITHSLADYIGKKFDVKSLQQTRMLNERKQAADPFVKHQTPLFKELGFPLPTYITGANDRFFTHAGCFCAYVNPVPVKVIDGNPGFRVRLYH